MGDAGLIGVLTIAGVVIVFFLGILGMFKAFYNKVPQGTALIVNDLSSSPKVHFTGAIVYPVIYKKELMKISLITLEVDRRGKDGLICRDNMRADITVAFYLRVNETPQDVLKVAKAIGAERASDKAAVNELFNAKFSEALKTVGKQIDFVKLFENRQEFRDRIVEVIGNDLNGYVLEDVAIDYLEQTEPPARSGDRSREGPSRQGSGDRLARARSRTAAHRQGKGAGSPAQGHRQRNPRPHRRGEIRGPGRRADQGSAADIIKIAMINIHKKLAEENFKSKMLLQVHDELVFDAYKPELEKLKTLVQHEMENAYKLTVPLDVDLGVGENWLEAH